MYFACLYYFCIFLLDVIVSLLKKPKYFSSLVELEVEREQLRQVNSF